MYGAADRAVDDCRPADDGTLEREAGRSTRPYRCRVAAAALLLVAATAWCADRVGSAPPPPPALSAREARGQQALQQPPAGARFDGVATMSDDDDSSSLTVTAVAYTFPNAIMKLHAKVEVALSLGELAHGSSATYAVAIQYLPVGGGGVGNYTLLPLWSANQTLTVDAAGDDGDAATATTLSNFTLGRLRPGATYRAHVFVAATADGAATLAAAVEFDVPMTGFPRLDMRRLASIRAARPVRLFKCSFAPRRGLHRRLARPRFSASVLLVSHSRRNEDATQCASRSLTSFASLWCGVARD